MSRPIRETMPDRRPRERLLRAGPMALSDAELIGLLLGSGRAGASATDVAEELLTAHGGLDRLRQATVDRLMAHPGVGPAKAALLCAAFALGRRTEAARGSTLRSSADIAAAVAEQLADAPHERVAVIVVDGANRVLRVETVSQGGADGAGVPVREIIALALRLDGRGIAVAHNHPSGELTPSRADLVATEALPAAALAVGLRFLDHVIVSGHRWRSLAETPEPDAS